jgi:hypothetical protein
VITHRLKRYLNGGTEEVKQLGALVLMWSGWVAAMTLSVLRVAHLGPEWGVVIILAIGVAIAAGQARVRHKLTDAIVGAFTAGVTIARDEEVALDDTARLARENRELIDELSREMHDRGNTTRSSK